MGAQILEAVSLALTGLNRSVRPGGELRSVAQAALPISWACFMAGLFLMSPMFQAPVP